MGGRREKQTNWKTEENLETVCGARHEKEELQKGVEETHNLSNPRKKNKDVKQEAGEEEGV